jgi:hypothetical protein
MIPYDRTLANLLRTQRTSCGRSNLNRQLAAVDLPQVFQSQATAMPRVFFPNPEE